MKENKTKAEQNIRDPSDNSKRCNIHELNWNIRREEKEKEEMFETIIAECFPKLTDIKLGSSEKNNQKITKRPHIGILFTNKQNKPTNKL